MTNQRWLWRRRDTGGVAIEMAIVLPILLLFLAVPLFYARIFWFYTVSEKAAHDAARFLSTATQTDLTGTTFGEAPIASVARQIVTEEMRGITPALSGLIVDIQCDLSTCGITVPQTVRVRVLMKIKDPFLSEVTGQFVGTSGLILASDMTMAYSGRQ